MNAHQVTADTAKASRKRGVLPFKGKIQKAHQPGSPGTKRKKKNMDYESSQHPSS